MGHDSSDSMNIVNGFDDEEGYLGADYSYTYKKSHPNFSDDIIVCREFVSDDSDQQFWAEDELSSSDSRINITKHRRRHSMSYRNRTYRSRSRLNFSSSSSYLLGNKIPSVRRRRKRLNYEDSRPSPSAPISSNNNTRKGMLKKNRDKKIRLLKKRKK